MAPAEPQQNIGPEDHTDTEGICRRPYHTVQNVCCECRHSFSTAWAFPTNSRNVCINSGCQGAHRQHADRVTATYTGLKRASLWSAHEAASRRNPCVAGVSTLTSTSIFAINTGTWLEIHSLSDGIHFTQQFFSVIEECKQNQHMHHFIHFHRRRGWIQQIELLLIRCTGCILQHRILFVAVLFIDDVVASPLLRSGPRELADSQLRSTSVIIVIIVAASLFKLFANLEAKAMMLRCCCQVDACAGQRRASQYVSAQRMAFKELATALDTDPVRR